MATKQQIIDYLTANPNLSDAQLVAYMAQNQISPAQLAEASGAPVGQISAQIGATIPNGQTIQLGDTIVQPVYQVSGSGDSEQVGGIQNVITYKADENKTGGAYTQYTPTGEVERTVPPYRIIFLARPSPGRTKGRPSGSCGIPYHHFITLYILFIQPPTIKKLLLSD